MAYNIYMIDPNTPVTLSGSHEFEMLSNITKETYRISISLPYGYDITESNKWPINNSPARWPTVYLLDADYHFGIVSDIVRTMPWSGRVREAIVIGVGYPLQGSAIQSMWNTTWKRSYDFTPVQDVNAEKLIENLCHKPVITGGADKFLDFLSAELIPKIDSMYRTDQAFRILVGHSLSGLFGTYVLLNRSDLFNSYVIGSPSLWYANEYIFDIEKLRATSENNLGGRVMLTAGGDEETIGTPNTSTTIRFAANLESRRYKELQIRRKIFEGLNHCEVIAPGFQAGLAWALQR